MIYNEQVIEKLKTIYDPEIPVNIYDLGLIYHIATSENNIHVLMTLTTATCPAAALLSEEVALVLQEIPGAGEINVEVVYEPRWTRDLMSPEAKSLLGFA
ncbi:MAG TPA: iron-sulfur cluster assembly protein [Flavisolibacter sp.]|jgi:metal-sulfur cluster biosynthetic enzyme|nr:iron-sulfur cluster assembly protein [Flavisolibacter sp.]